MAGVAIGSLVIRSTNVIEPTVFLYYIQPLALVFVAGLAYMLAGNERDRSRHQADKAIIVGSIIAIWFVLYMVTGLVVTYVSNTLLSSPQAFFVNLGAFAVPVIALEYTRHRLMLIAGRRNALAFGVLVASVFALQQISFLQFDTITNAQEAIELLIGSFVPATVSSFLLTYLAVSSGLPAMLTYQLGIVATTILPPIIPKYDWYLTGISSLLLAIVVYLAIERASQSREALRGHHKHHARRSYDVMLVIAMIAMVLFVTGAFTYKPIVILSNSMQPVFGRGAAVVVQKTDDPIDIQEGDIIQYERDGTQITHRVVKIDTVRGDSKLVFTTKGDNSPSEDPPVAANQVVGIVRARVPVVGYPTVWLYEIGKRSE